MVFSFSNQDDQLFATEMASIALHWLVDSRFLQVTSRSTVEGKLLLYPLIQPYFLHTIALLPRPPRPWRSYAYIRSNIHPNISGRRYSTQIYRRTHLPPRRSHNICLRIHQLQNKGTEDQIISVFYELRLKTRLKRPQNGPSREERPKAFPAAPHVSPQSCRSEY